VHSQYPQLWTFYQAFLGIYFSILLVLSILGFVILQRDLRSSAVANISRWALGMLIFLNIVTMLHFSLDPYGTKHLSISFVFINIIDGIRNPTALFIFVVITLHWVEIYQESIRRLHENEMISKIRSDISKEVTIDDILSSVRNVHRFRLPCAIGLFIFYLFRIAGSIMKGLLIPASNQMQLVFTIILIILFGLVVITSSFFGVKLYRLFPKPLDVRMRRLTINICGLMLYAIMMFIVIAVVQQRAKFTPATLLNFFCAEFLTSLLITVAGSWVLSIFLGPHLHRIRSILSRSFGRSNVSTTGSTLDLQNSNGTPGDI